MTKTKLASLFLALMGAGAAWYSFTTAADPGAVTEVDPGSFAELKSEFNAAAGQVRIIALLSPT